MGDAYIKSGMSSTTGCDDGADRGGAIEFRRTKTTDNPIHIIGFLSQWKLYLDEVEAETAKANGTEDVWRGRRMSEETFEKLSNEQAGQLYELMHATKDVWKTSVRLDLSALRLLTCQLLTDRRSSRHRQHSKSSTTPTQLRKARTRAKRRHEDDTQAALHLCSTIIILRALLETTAGPSLLMVTSVVGLGGLAIRSRLLAGTARILVRIRLLLGVAAVSAAMACLLAGLQGRADRDVDLRRLVCQRARF